ncbi:Sjogren's syndrome/scleroderma autoantigen 1 family protein [Natrialbaceae archaeon A-chndr2]
MSDFDKEAEREKLRKKYEKDKQDREATQRMSDLLLKGATMTNSHCNTCGDPLFRQSGTTFCPSCHGGPEGVEASVPGEDGAGAARADLESETGAGETRAEPQEPDTTRDVNAAASQQPPRESAGAAPDQPGNRHSSTETGQPSPPEPGKQGEAVDPEPETPSSPGPGRDRPSAVTPTPDSRSIPTGDLEAATDALVVALERFARAGAQAESPREAKANLEAAHEAAAALSTLRE